MHEVLLSRRFFGHITLHYICLVNETREIAIVRVFLNKTDVPLFGSFLAYDENRLDSNPNGEREHVNVCE